MTFPADQELDFRLGMDPGGKVYRDYTDFFSIATGLMLFNDCFTVMPQGSTLLGSLHMIKNIYIYNPYLKAQVTDCTSSITSLTLPRFSWEGEDRKKKIKEN